MSRQDVAAVEEALSAFARGGLDALAEHWADDIDWRAMEGAIDDHGPIRGKDAGRAYVQDWLDLFDGFKIELVEVVDAGDDKVVTLQRVSGRARESGVDVPPLTYAVLYVVRDGKIAVGREFATREQALEAAGIGHLEAESPSGFETERPSA